jgi:hypothetical protein
MSPEVPIGAPAENPSPLALPFAFTAAGHLQFFTYQRQTIARVTCNPAP